MIWLLTYPQTRRATHRKAEKERQLAHRRGGRSRTQIKSMLTLHYQSVTQIQIIQITKWRQNFKQSSYPKDLPVGAISIEAGRFIANLRCFNNIYDIFYKPQTRVSQLNDLFERFRKMLF
jgi:hypothetical protein